MLKVITLCSGYDSQCMALDRLGVSYELIAWSEIDKYSIQAHNAVYPQYADRNLGDLTRIDWSTTSGCDLLTYSTPCQDISIAGKRKGLEICSGTRSSILWHIGKAIREFRPKYLLMENVPELVHRKFIKDFHLWQSLVCSYGYANYTKVLNAKHYGVPQNRERVFMVSIRNDLSHGFEFPLPVKLDKLLFDLLEQSVDEKYYLSDNAIKYVLSESSGFKGGARSL